MRCCQNHTRSASRLFSFFAGNYCRRFKRKGFEATQKQLMSGLDTAGYQDAHIMEIGCGVGHLHQSMLEKGAKDAVGIDLAPSMIELAEQWAVERDLGESTEYLVGDYVDISEQLDEVDVTLLDKVVCCYPDSDSLVHRSLEKTKHVYALTYPRNTWYVRVGEKLGAFLMWLMRSDFRGYVHDPVIVESWIKDAGFKKAYENTTLFWLTQVYVK